MAGSGRDAQIAVAGGACSRAHQGEQVGLISILSCVLLASQATLDACPCGHRSARAQCWPFLQVSTSRGLVRAPHTLGK